MSNKSEASSGGSAANDSKTTTDSKVCTENLTETDAFITNSLNLDPAEEYNMGHKQRGLALIFNQDYFYWLLGLGARSGSEADRNNLARRLKQLNFEVRCYDNLKQVEILEKIHEAAEEDHSDADCFLLTFMSHGEDDHVFAHDGKINIQEITAMFKGDKCKTLVGKPKIFIMQACRGDKHDVPVTQCDVVDNKVNEVVVDASSIHTLPAGADFVMCYSVAQGYFSHRETVNGSWYIQDLCELLWRFGNTLEFTELLTLVNRKVSMRSVGNARDPNAIGKKQVPCFASMLTKKLYFRTNK
ncbi:caspase-6 [Nothobranchius furzeri]|uniref:Caspase-6 n=3 Tax=Nothobranchius TaxID=28779 RepID=A0A9D2YC08_NOTFU|nr:caspase-6 [Nothobranchius furzeri]KAF7217996.1 caspase 6 [Nothobranchius furzeri]